MTLQNTGDVHISNNAQHVDDRDTEINFFTDMIRARFIFACRICHTCNRKQRKRADEYSFSHLNDNLHTN